MRIFGKNSVREALNIPNQIKKVYLTPNFKDQEIIKKIKDSKVQFEPMKSQIMDKYNTKNQGIMAIIDDFNYTSLEDVLNDKIIVILDHLEDPHNFGAIIRTAESAGIKSIIIPKDRSVDVTETVMKTSSGALNYINIVRVTNLANTIDKLKENSYFIYGAEANGENIKDISYADKTVLIIGSEGHGLSSLVRKKCDYIISLPMKGKVNSLNASVAAGILMYDIITK